MNVIAGALAGLLAFAGARSVLSAWLYDMAPGDARVLAATLVVLAFVAAGASWIPVRRATRIDPAITLRLE
jgi:ABC-type antimicrobial peptide transport system permease subunit